jgi:hypothetical protein
MLTQAEALAQACRQLINFKVKQQLEYERSLITIEIDQGIQKSLPEKLQKLEAAVALELKRTQSRQQFLQWIAMGTKSNVAWILRAPFSALFWIAERFGEAPYSHLLFVALIFGNWTIGAFLALNLPCRTTKDVCYLLRVDKSTFIISKPHKTKPSKKAIAER